MPMNRALGPPMAIGWEAQKEPMNEKPKEWPEG